MKRGKLNTGSNRSKNSTGGKGKRKHLQRNKPGALQEVLSHSHTRSASSLWSTTWKFTAGQGGPRAAPPAKPPGPLVAAAGPRYRTWGLVLSHWALLFAASIELKTEPNQTLAD